MSFKNSPITHAHFTVPEVGIWDVELSIGYDTAPFKWRGEAKSIEDAQEKAWEAMQSGATTPLGG